LPRLDKKKIIKASVNTVYDIMKDYSILPRWNIVINEATELEPGKYFFKTNVGDVTNTEIENIPNERMTSTQEGSPMTSIGYIFKPVDEGTEVTLWAEFELEDQRSVMEIAGDLFLKSLKVYVDYIKSGGNPEAYKKKFSAIKKA